MKIIIDPVTSKRYERLDDEYGSPGNLTARDCQILVDALDLLETAATKDAVLSDHCAALSNLFEAWHQDGDLDQLPFTVEP